MRLTQHHITLSSNLKQDNPWDIDNELRVRSWYRPQLYFWYEYWTILEETIGTNHYKMTISKFGV